MDDPLFNAGYGDCATYDDENEDNCVAHRACDACGCSCDCPGTKRALFQRNNSFVHTFLLRQFSWERLTKNWE